MCCLLPALLPLPSTPGLLQLAHPWGLGQGTSDNTALLPTARSSYHIPDCLFPPFALLCHQSFTLFLLACAEPRFTVLPTHRSTYRKIGTFSTFLPSVFCQTEVTSHCVSGRPPIEIIITVYVNLNQLAFTQNIFGSFLFIYFGSFLISSYKYLLIGMFNILTFNITIYILEFKSTF